MKSIVTLLFILTFSLGFAQDKKETPKTKIVEASCGQCQFGMKSKSGCDLAVRMDGKSYFVEGTKLDDHGDAHAADGFCSAIRKAEVSGEIVNDKYVATSFKLLPQEQKK
ncbi:DUF6370 family protein [Flavobacterium aquatile]|uniref:Glutaminyl-tRNA synthetase n=1 Tax=Flavobacterium aquatile LMG 4008 = ATCC 11947 TaxID=1453498 RepID=A0A095V329_9FLAO|nr:DUF6370 family protein [Flavobacterium aquatile]KGD69255.1 glutaminyl-tRNA synthetase [Flavobacterium aquatile LMG 4008 = ATCC 11947]OXA69508.1 hypothetical protein B0A61_00260 [Flavobacterium aquatile LMG 4008 = ATCC 11947]GEC79752.1 hypothetical protein FAQ01_26220 [Flavobacterium aquatile]